MRTIYLILITIVTLTSYNTLNGQSIFEYPFSGEGKIQVEESTIFQVVDGDRIPQYYYIDIPQFICQTKDEPKRESLRLYWDAYGRYIRYQLIDGSTLIKLNGKPFSPKEYSKLHKILNNPNSKLSLCKYDDLTGRECENQYQVDAISGATSSADDIEMVNGATKVTYDLWSLAYGEISKRIEEITTHFAKRQYSKGAIKISTFGSATPAMQVAYLNQQLNSTRVLNPTELNTIIGKIDTNNYALYSGIIHNIERSQKGIKGYKEALIPYLDNSNSFISGATFNAFQQAKESRYIKEYQPNFNVVEF